MPDESIWDDELTEEGEAVGELAGSGSAPKQREETGASDPVRSESRPERAAPSSVSIIKTPEDMPEALERMTGANESFWYDRMKTDREWLARRVGNKK